MSSKSIWTKILVVDFFVISPLLKKTLQRVRRLGLLPHLHNKINPFDTVLSAHPYRLRRKREFPETPAEDE
jgi:hypothetical protein